LDTALGGNWSPADRPVWSWRCVYPFEADRTRTALAGNRRSGPHHHGRPGAATTDDELEDGMAIVDSTVLVTGANRGIGQALVQQALSRGASRVYAGTRQPISHPDSRVIPLTLDVTSAAQIQAAVERVPQLDILINNAGVGSYEDVGDRVALERHLVVNVFGTHAVTQAFLPLLTGVPWRHCERLIRGSPGRAADHACLLDV
jgi:hypothetical protein